MKTYVKNRTKQKELLDLVKLKNFYKDEDELWKKIIEGDLKYKNKNKLRHYYWRWLEK